MIQSKTIFLCSILLWIGQCIFAQEGKIQGYILTTQGYSDDIEVYLKGTNFSTVSDNSGYYSFSKIPIGQYLLVAEDRFGKVFTKEVRVFENQTTSVDLNMFAENRQNYIDEIVISGTKKPVQRKESPVPVEVYHANFFRKTASTNLFDALQNINGVRPQTNCNVCNTGDIRVNGLDGPYTMVLIDGMPIVSALGTVYGLSGIPTSLIERIEVVKGPASSLYGSEAVAGLINVITKKPGNAPKFYSDISATSWGEYNVDVAFKFKADNRVTALTGINYFKFGEKIDKNKDGFTDKTLQERASIFQKWNFERSDNRVFSLVARYLYEDRWGGDIRWNKSFRGGDKIYAESIYTNRLALIGNYQLPVEEKLFFEFSFNYHRQNSRYGNVPYNANQKIAFGQLLWDKELGKHDLLAGAALRYTFYDDDTPVTFDAAGNHPEQTWLPGIFIQDEITFSKHHELLLGMRYDYNNNHGSIFTPRLAYKWLINQDRILRLNLGTGFRVVNVFSEDHAALTGGRKVIISEHLKPEKSYNANLNFNQKFYTENGTFIGIDATAFFTYFTNRIIGDYESHPTKIIYDNLQGYSISKGVSLNVDLDFKNGLDLTLGATLMDNNLTKNEKTERILKTERFTGTWSVSYKIVPWDLDINYTGNVYSPMRLPLLGPLDPRPEYSPWWSIQNIQFTYGGLKHWEVYAGIKNILNWTMARGTPFIIARPQDPFDKDVVFDGQGRPVVTPDNPYGLIFDPDSYSYGTNQGLHAFLGVRFKL